MAPLTKIAKILRIIRKWGRQTDFLNGERLGLPLLRLQASVKLDQVVARLGRWLEGLDDGVQPLHEVRAHDRLFGLAPEDRLPLQRDLLHEGAPYQVARLHLLPTVTKGTKLVVPLSVVFSL
jgi:hypothetical protein